MQAAHRCIRVCVASMCKLVYLRRVRDTNDLIFAIWPVTLCTQTVQCLSIVTYSSLYLKPLFEALDSGFMRSDDLRRKGLKAPDGNYDLSFLSADRANDAAAGSKRLRQAGNISTVTTDGREAGLDSNSQNSQSPIIQKTRTFAIIR